MQHGHFLKKNQSAEEVLNRVRTKIKEGSIEKFHLEFSDDIRNDRFKISPQEIDWLQRNDESKWGAYLTYRHKFSTYPRLKILTSFPLYVLIEPASVCNLRCVMCFQVDKSFTNKEFMGFMKMNLFEKVVDQIKAGGTEAVTLASRGEPTLHPQFGIMLKKIGEKEFLDTKINTNATRLTETMCHDILDAGINEVVFSVDAGTKETYERIRVNGHFEEVVKNVERFHEIRLKKYRSSKTVTRISGVKVDDAQDVGQMMSFWYDRVDQVTIKEAIPRWDTYNNPQTLTNEPCSTLWDRMYVWQDGTVNPCDFDYKSNLKVGDANTTSLKDIWNGEAYQKLREDHLKKMRVKHMPCDRCPLS